MKSKLLKNCKILEDGNFVTRHIRLEDHKIAYIDDEISSADEVIDIKENKDSYLFVCKGMYKNSLKKISVGIKIIIKKKDLPQEDMKLMILEKNI